MDRLICVKDYISYNSILRSKNNFNMNKNIIAVKPKNATKHVNFICILLN